MPETSKSSQPPSIRIAIADQQPIFRHGLRRLLETDSRLVIVSETGDGTATVTVIRDLRPDVLLLGLSAPGERATSTSWQLWTREYISAARRAPSKLPAKSQFFRPTATSRS